MKIIRSKKDEPDISIKKKDAKPDFRIVGIGASAGGLEASGHILNQVPENRGMAFVVIQHLDQTVKWMLPELLQRITKLEVILVLDNMTVKPNCIYVIPPNKSISILKRQLHLFEQSEARGLRLPVDFFFYSLSDDLLDKAVGAILSGMGADDTQLKIGASGQFKALVITAHHSLSTEECSMQILLNNSNTPEAILMIINRNIPC